MWYSLCPVDWYWLGNWPPTSYGKEGLAQEHPCPAVGRVVEQLSWRGHWHHLVLSRTHVPHYPGILLLQPTTEKGSHRSGRGMQLVLVAGRWWPFALCIPIARENVKNSTGLLVHIFYSSPFKFNLHKLIFIYLFALRPWIIAPLSLIKD